MFFADTSNAQYAIEHFGIPGLLFVGFLWVAYLAFNRLLDKTVEVHKKQLELLNKRDEIRFSGLTQIRVTQIANLYDKLNELYWAGTEYFPGSNPKEEKSQAFFDKLVETWPVVHKAKIYFSKEHATKLVAFIDELRAMGMDRLTYTEHSKTEDLSQMREIISANMTRWQKLIKDIPAMLESIEEDFRDLLGVERKDK